MSMPPLALRFCHSDGPADEFRFILNGLRNANKVLGEPAFVENDWKVIGEYVYDAEGGRHQAFYAPKRDTIVMGQRIRSHERMHVEQSLKYSKAEAEELWKRAGMEEISQWRHREEYGMWLYIPFRPRTQDILPFHDHNPHFPAPHALCNVGPVRRQPRVSEHIGVSSLASGFVGLRGWHPCPSRVLSCHYLDFAEASTL